MKLIDILTEVIGGGTITIYHRTKFDPNIIKDGFIPSGKGMHGIGMYATYYIEDQMISGMSQKYGKYIMEYEVPNTKRFIIFDKDEAKRVFGDNHELIDQLRKILKGKFLKLYIRDKSKIDYLDRIMSEDSTKNSIQYADYMVLTIPKLLDYVDGLIFSGIRHGRVMVLFNYGIATPIRYTDDNGENWKNLK